jgi:putative endonuclease
MKSYYVYILTNPGKTVLYVGVTNSLTRRITEHFFNKGKRKTFAGRYYSYLLVYYEQFSNPTFAIRREKEVKKWRREKKEKLISKLNPEWKALDFPHW